MDTHGHSSQQERGRTTPGRICNGCCSSRHRKGKRVLYACMYATKFSPSQGRKFTCSTRAARAREFRRRVFILITYICTHVRGGTGDEGEPIKERCLPRERSAALNYECLLFLRCCLWVGTLNRSNEKRWLRTEKTLGKAK